MNEYVERLKNRTDIRQTAIELRQALREEAHGEALAQYLAGDFSVFTDLLHHEDPKVRKNIALILGELKRPELREALWEAYRGETIRFVRPAYIKALEHYDCRPYIAEIKERIRILAQEKQAPENEKHIREEQTALNGILIKTEGRKRHTFTGYDARLEVILLMNREQRDAVIRQIPDAQDKKKLAGGVRFVTKDLKQILPLRTYSELLFPIAGAPALEGNPENMAAQLVRSHLLHFLKEHHEAGAPFYFRVEVRSAAPREQKSDLAKKLAFALEKASGHALQNAPGDYEMELRLVANKEGRFVPLLKLFTIKDRRFAYRKEALPVSIAPVNAALIMELAKEYFTEDARVLDPFCGVGTMLAERAAACPAGVLYGVDILEEAVEKARRNTQAFRNMYYINRDFFDFSHEHAFDEIITDLPAAGKTRGQRELALLYGRFFKKVPEIAREGALIVAYTPAYRIFREQLEKAPGFRLLKEFCINEREQSYAAVIRYFGG